MYFNAYPVLPGMGLRESINAMLSHVAYNGRDFGYLPSALHLSNCERIADDYAGVVVMRNNTLELVPHVSDSALLEDLTGVLIELCNNYPAYDDEDMARIEHARVLEFIAESRNESEPEPDMIARGLHEVGAHIEQSEYGANCSERDWIDAVQWAKLNAR